MKTEFLITSLERSFEPMQDLIDKVLNPLLTLNEKVSIYENFEKCYNQTKPILYDYCSSLIKELQDENENKINKINLYEETISGLTYLKLYLFCDYTRQSFNDIYVILNIWKNKYKQDILIFNNLLESFSLHYSYNLDIWKDSNIFNKALSLLEKETISTKLKNILYTILKNQRERALTKNSPYLKIYF